MSAPRAQPQRKEDPSPLRTLTQWATRTHLQAPPGASDSRLQKVARGIYDSMAPQPTPPAMNVPAQRAHIGALQRMHASPDFPLAIAPQSHDKRAAEDRSSPAQHLKRHPRTALSEFAYRYRPEERRDSDPTGRSSRLTVNMNPAHSQAVATALGGLLGDGEANQPLRALKVMGPARIGQRVDDAVLYLRGHDEKGARRVAKNLQTALQGTPGALVDHGPPGMLRVAPGVSYAETVPGDSTSHGSARKKIVSKSVQDFRGLGGAMEHHVSYRALRAGYNPNVPSHALPPGRPDLLRQIRSIDDVVNSGGTVHGAIARVGVQQHLRDSVLARRQFAHY